MKKLTVNILRTTGLAILIATLTACGGSSGGSQPSANCATEPTITLGNQTVACTDGSCSLLQLQWNASKAPGDTLNYSINTSPATTGKMTGAGTSGYVDSLTGSSTPLLLGASSKSYTVTFKVGACPDQAAIEIHKGS